MDERHLLLLGLLMAQSQHGYSINEFIEKNLGRVSGMKRATAYALLERLHSQGLVHMATEAVGNYPPRKVYSITPAGRDAFLGLIQKLLVRTEDRTEAADIALMFVDYLENDQILALLRRRASKLESQILELRATPGHKNAPGVDYALSRKHVLLQAEHEWTLQLIARLEETASHRPSNGEPNKGTCKGECK